VTPIDGADDAKDDNDETSDDKCKGSLISSTALFTFLNFWIHIYSSDSVMYTNGGELANALAMVVRVGLDTIFYEGKRVGAVHSRLLGVMVRHYSKNIGEVSELRLRAASRFFKPPSTPLNSLAFLVLPRHNLLPRR